jgi:hypothetical protein
MKVNYVHCECCNFEELNVDLECIRKYDNKHFVYCPNCGMEIYVNIKNEKDYKMNTIEIVKSEEENIIIPMNKMKPLQIGIISGWNYSNINGHIVMRTASGHRFEVMDITNPGPDKCWTSEDIDIKVKLLPNAVLKVFI